MSDQEGFDYAVIGAGIAGLAIAELFSRSGLKVVLIEEASKVCTEASGAHHGWFHFGSLYSIFPNNQFMRTLVGGIDDLLAYYSDFSGMNLRVGESGKLVVDAVNGGWIRNDYLHYIVSARNDKDFDLHHFEGVSSYAKKVFFTAVWDLAIKQFISRHQRFHQFDWRKGPASEYIPRAGWRDYSRNVISKLEGISCDLPKNTHFVVQGFDRPMDARAIISQLLSSFLANTGQLRLNTSYSGFHHLASGGIEVDTSIGPLKCKKLIIASGKGLKKMSMLGSGVKVVASPLLVAFPAVSNKNFARLTPFVSKTINHILHRVGDQQYSLIGGGYIADPEDPASMNDSRSSLLKMAEQVFPSLKNATVKETYLSYKTEFVSQPGERNYQYVIRNPEPNVYAVLPGKFSLAFSLAVNLFKSLEKREPAKRLNHTTDVDVSSFVGMMRHAAIVCPNIQ